MLLLIYSSVPSVEKFLKNIKLTDPNKAVQGEFFYLKINKRAGQIPIHMQDGINMQGEFFLKINKCLDQNKTVHACLLGTIEY